MGQPQAGERPGDAVPLAVGVHPDDVDLAEVAARRVDLGPVEAGEPARVAVLEEDHALGVEPRLGRALGQTCLVEGPLLGVVDEGRSVDGEQRRLVLPRSEGAVPQPLRQRRVDLVARAHRAGEHEQPAHDVQAEALGQRAGGRQVPVRPRPGVGSALQDARQQSRADPLRPITGVDEGLDGPVVGARRVAEEPVAVGGDDVVTRPGQCEDEGLAERLDAVDLGGGRGCGAHLLEHARLEDVEGGDGHGHRDTASWSVWSSCAGTNR